MPVGDVVLGQDGAGQGVMGGCVCGHGRTHGVIPLTAAAVRVAAHVAGLQEWSWWPWHCGGRRLALGGGGEACWGAAGADQLRDTAASRDCSTVWLKGREDACEALGGIVAVSLPVEGSVSEHCSVGCIENNFSGLWYRFAESSHLSD